MYTRAAKNKTERLDSTSEDGGVVGGSCRLEDLEGVVAKAVQAAVQVVRDEF